MLDKFDLLKAVSSADEHDIADCAEFFNIKIDGHSKKIRRISRTFIVAAIIAALLAVTASAIGISIYLRHQQELKEHYNVEENQVVNYEEYPVDSENGLKILSCLTDAEGYRIHVSVSPITEEEFDDIFNLKFSRESRANSSFKYIDMNLEDIMVSLYTSGWDFPAEDLGEPEKDENGNILFNEDGTPICRPTVDALYRRYKEEAYDAQTQSLLLELWIYDGPVAKSEPIMLNADLKSISYDENENICSEELIRHLGENLLTPPVYKPLTIYFPEPIEIVSEEKDVHLIYDGMEFSNSTIYILMRSPEAEYVYKYDPNMSEDELSAQAVYREKWQDLRWENDRAIKINFKDGEIIKLYGAEASQFTDGIVRGLCLIGEPPTINYNNIESIFIAGQTVNISDCRVIN